MLNFILTIFYFGGMYGWYVTSSEESKMWKFWNSFLWPFELGAEIAAWQVERNKGRVKNGEYL